MILESFNLLKDIISSRKIVKLNIKSTWYPKNNRKPDDRRGLGYVEVMMIQASPMLKTNTGGKKEDEDSDDDLFRMCTSDRVAPAPKEMEDGGQATIDELIEVNLGTIEEPEPIFISAVLSLEEREEYIKCLTQNKDCFAWTYKQMPGLERSIAEHHLSLDSTVKPVKQGPRHMNPQVRAGVMEEIARLKAVNFIEPVTYTQWLSNVVPVKKKNGQIRVCVDFRDLNKACPKDDFPLPLIEQMVDATTGHEALSFMDGYSGYNQILMAEEDTHFF
jgi:hypothetical protein